MIMFVTLIPVGVRSIGLVSSIVCIVDHSYSVLVVFSLFLLLLPLLYIFFLPLFLITLMHNEHFLTTLSRNRSSERLRKREEEREREHERRKKELREFMQGELMLKKGMNTRRNEKSSSSLNNITNNKDSSCRTYFHFLSLSLSVPIPYFHSLSVPIPYFLPSGRKENERNSSHIQIH